MVSVCQHADIFFVSKGKNDLKLSSSCRWHKFRVRQPGKIKY